MAWRASPCTAWCSTTPSRPRSTAAVWRRCRRPRCRARSPLSHRTGDRMHAGTRSLETRKLAFFVGEQVALFGSFVFATWVAARVLGQGADWFRFLTEAAVVTCALQL